jgi:hypothetical protein
MRVEGSSYMVTFKSGAREGLARFTLDVPGFGRSLLCFALGIWHFGSLRRRGCMMQGGSSVMVTFKSGTTESLARFISDDLALEGARHVSLWVSTLVVFVDVVV